MGTVSASASHLTTPVPTEPVAGLPVLRSVFASLDCEGVPYCHWKSNEHLHDSMQGTADLDILVARDSAIDFARVMAELNFRRFAAAPGRAYSGVEDYLGMDAESGQMVHLHVHYELTLGEKYLKGYRIPWEGVLMQRRVRNDEFGVWVSDEASELLLLLVRAVLKVRWRDLLRGSRRVMPDYMDRELRWLADRTSVEEVEVLAVGLLGGEAAGLVRELIARPDAAGLRAFRKAIAPCLKSWKSYSASGAVLRRWYREGLVRSGAVQRALGLRTGVSPRRRVMPRGGVFIAFVGPDGSGKSTLTKEVGSWLGWKLDVLRVYGGSGAHSAGFPRRVMQRLRAATRSREAGSRVPEGGGSNTKGTERVSLARLAWIASLARERVLSARRARYARNRGMIVLSDRLAQTQFAGINDGPRLGSYLEGPASLRRLVARYERESFRSVEQSPPDLVVRLNLPFQVARERKPDTPELQLKRKLELVPRLTWPEGTRVVEVDASQPLEAVLRDVKLAVWEVL